jgi:DNA-binding IclR family transcriptional regulator
MAIKLTRGDGDLMEELIGFLMGNKQRERVVQVLGSKGRMSAERLAKVEHIPGASARRTLDELAQRRIIDEDAGAWGLTETGLELFKELRKRA